MHPLIKRSLHRLAIQSLDNIFGSPPFLLRVHVIFTTILPLWSGSLSPHYVDVNSVYSVYNISDFVSILRPKKY